MSLIDLIRYINFILLNYSAISDDKNFWAKSLFISFTRLVWS